jgi:hypothetical protein
MPAAFQVRRLCCVNRGAPTSHQSQRSADHGCGEGLSLHTRVSHAGVSGRDLPGPLRARCGSETVGD